jgi:two-component system cell cycle sensor histidine kinase/response regulator CckA
MAELGYDVRARLRGLLAFVSDLAGGDFRGHHPISEHLDELDALGAGLNVLAEDLATERARRAEAEERLRDAVEGYESAPGMFCSVDAASGIVVQCNTTMERWLNRPRSQIVGQPLMALYRPTSHDFVRASLDALLAESHVPAGDHELLGGDGRALPTLLSGSVVRDDTGTAQRLRLIYRDVTEERRLEAQLIHAQKMEGIGRLAGGVAHDFNNLLTAIFVSAEMLRPNVSGAEGHDDLDQLLAAAQRAAELTSHLLAFSRRTVVAPQAVNVNDCLLNLDKLLRRTIGEHIGVTTVAADGLWNVVVDPSRFEQVVMNLAINARDAMPNGGRLTLETQNVTLDDENSRTHPGIGSGDYVMLAVSDNGVGMQADILERLFEPFFTTKEVGQGTGLGLAMVYGIVRQAGGSVAVHSEPGSGSTFKVYLPRVTEEPPEATPSPVKAAAGGSETILVVEDDDMVRTLVLRTLRSAGYDVLEAKDGVDALEVLRRRGLPVALTLTDVVMPRLGGRELADQLVADGLSHRVLFMSGYTKNPVVHNGVLEQGVAFLQKPFTPSGLLTRRVREMLDRPAFS